MLGAVVLNDVFYTIMHYYDRLHTCMLVPPKARNKDFTLIGRFVFPWRGLASLCPDLIGHFGKMTNDKYPHHVSIRVSTI